MSLKQRGQTLLVSLEYSSSRNRGYALCPTPTGAVALAVVCRLWSEKIVVDLRTRPELCRVEMLVFFARQLVQPASFVEGGLHLQIGVPDCHEGFVDEWRGSLERTRVFGRDREIAMCRRE